MAYECENKNKNCMTLTKTFSEGAWSKSTRKKGGFLGIGRKTIVKESSWSNSWRKDRQECWLQDDCTKILAKHYDQEKRQEHELELKKKDMELAWEKEARQAKKDYLNQRLKDLLAINQLQADALLKDGEISRWNWVMINQSEYIEQLISIMKAINGVTGTATGNMNDLETKTRDAVEILDYNKDKNSTYKLLRSGKIGTRNKKTVQQLFTIAETGKQMRKVAQASEKEYAKVVYEIVNNVPVQAGEDTYEDVHKGPL